eukprot:scaffold43742_cov33-Prasinocladus_malaysianus.AAC.1
MAATLYLRFPLLVMLGLLRLVMLGLLIALLPVACDARSTPVALDARLMRTPICFPKKPNNMFNQSRKTLVRATWQELETHKSSYKPRNSAHQLTDKVIN